METLSAHKYIFLGLFLGIILEKLRASLKPIGHRDTMVLRGLRGPLTLTPTPRSFSKIAEKTPGTIVSKSQNSL